MNLMSYPNAEINVDGDASDWNLSQFGEIVVGGIAAVVEGEAFWERVTGTGDIAFVGWDDEDDNLFYAGRSTSRVLPVNRADHTAKVYARDNEIFQYFLIDITDDEINTGEDDAWANDSVEFYIDPEGTGTKGGDRAYTTSYNWSDPLTSGFPMLRPATGSPSLSWKATQIWMELSTRRI